RTPRETNSTPAKKNKRQCHALGGKEMQVHRHIDRRLRGEENGKASRGKAGERIVIAYGAYQHANDNECKQRYQRETQHDAKFLCRHRKHEISMTLRKNALHCALARPFAEPAATHETFCGNIDVEGVAGTRVEEALNTTRHM